MCPNAVRDLTPADLEEWVDEAWRALKCLALEVPPPVYDDASPKIARVLREVPSLLRAVRERDRLRAQLREAEDRLLMKLVDLADIVDRKSLEENRRLRDALERVERRTAAHKANPGEKGHRCDYRRLAESAHATARAALHKEESDD